VYTLSADSWIKTLIFGAIHVFIVLIVLFLMACGAFPFLLLMRQSLGWLQTGVVVDTDLKWALADVQCYATNFEPKGWEGKDVCRNDNIVFTDWVGANQLLNSIAEIHIVFFGLFAWAVAAAIFANLEHNIRFEYKLL